MSTKIIFIQHNIKNNFKYTQYGYIRTTVNVSVLVVLTFSQNFSTNGPYVVLIFCKFSDMAMREFVKDENLSHSILSRWLADKEEILKRALEGCTCKNLSTIHIQDV